MDSSRFVPAPGVTLHLLERNPEGSPAVLFLHGWLDHAHSHDWLRDALPSSWRTIALDFRGHGQSGHVPGGLYHITDYLADVEFALDACGIEHVHLVGHSLGGTVALLYAAAHPARVATVTSIESVGPTGGREPDTTVHRARQFLRDLHKPHRKRVYPTILEAAARLRENVAGLSEPAAMLLARHGTRPVEGGFEFTYDPAHRRMFGASLDEWQTLALFGAVQCPVQILQATEGFAFDEGTARERLVALRAPAPKRVPGGHHVHLDSPGEVASIVRVLIEAKLGKPFPT